MNLATQYDKFADDFSHNQDVGENSNNQNREEFYKHLTFLQPGMRVLDLACGDGTDLMYYTALGLDAHGLDASKALIDIARQKLTQSELTVADFDDVPYEDSSFDVVLSKYAVMTSVDMLPAFKEIHRILKPGGTMLYLVTHPFRQYFERKDSRADYFEQVIVDCNILNGSVTVKEPTHVMGEFLCDFLFKNFDVKSYDEHWDPAAEQIDGKKYPGYFILKAVKR